MRSIFDQGAPEPVPDPFNLAAYVLRASQRLPDKIALAELGESGAKRWSYAQLEARVLAMGGALLAQGLQPGDRVMLRLGNTAAFPVAYLGAIAVGLVAIPTSAALTASEVDTICALARPQLILSDRGIALPAAPPCPVMALKELPKATPATYHMGDPNRLGYVLFTSGTTGTPRAVAHAHRAIWARRMMYRDWYGLREDDRLLHAGAFNWSYTLGTGLMDPWSLGATALIPALGTATEALPLLLKRHEATIFAAVPGVYRRLLRSEKLDLPALRHGLSAGEKLPEATRAAWQARTGTAIHEAYGMSECSTFVSGGPERPAPPDTLGLGQTGRRLAIVGADNTPVPMGEIGRIAISTADPGLMLGYLEDGSPAPVTGDWFITGDLGEMKDTGAIRYHGRADDMMNAGGYRVSPLEVEAALASHAGVTEVAAVELQIKPDVTVIAAFYVGTADEPTLRAHAETCLADYKRPRIYIRQDSLPRGANGKLLRRTLRAAPRPLDPGA